jgi:hypothetical protein
MAGKEPLPHPEFPKPDLVKVENDENNVELVVA